MGFRYQGQAARKGKLGLQAGNYVKVADANGSGGGSMFIIEKDAAQYINESAHAVVIELRLEPCTGGCLCSPVNVTGSYVPTLALGKPSQDEEDRYQLQSVEGVEVYFSTGLAVKQGFSEIRIKLKRFLWFRWLELEGAKGIASYSA
jgi:hypothetical protein